MDGLSFKTGVTGFSSSVSVPGSQNPPGSMQVCAVGRGGGMQANANGISVENPTPQISVPSPSSRYFFTYPLRSLWPSRKRQGDALLNEEEDEGPVLELATDGEIYPNMGISLGEVQESDEQEENEPVGSSEQVPGQPNGYFNNCGNWVLKILHVRSLWKSQRGTIECSGSDECEKQESVNEDAKSKAHSSCCEEGLEGCSVDEEHTCSSDGEIPIADVQYDKDSFSRLLRRVSLVDAKVYAQMSYLGSLAYAISQIKPERLLKYQGLRFVTSSLEKKKAQAATTEKEQAGARVVEREKLQKHDGESHRKKGIISPSTAYQIAAAAASYLHSQTRSFLPFKSVRPSASDEDAELGIKSPSTWDSSEVGNRVDTGSNLATSSSAANPTGTKISSSEVASFVATTNSVTAVVAAKEEMRHAVAEDLKSAHSSPCDWFICDDEFTNTRFFVIQGSESLESWQANLLFEPIQFEGLDVLVHRGIYEAAKGIYEQMLPEVRAHLKSHGDSATFRFTGHSLGGSLSLLVNLMLLIRCEVPKSCLLPVITFGSPCIMCGGDHLLRKLGLPRSHVQAITLHRDIVPRAFSCSYPDHVAELLKAVNSNFRKHPCLKNQKLLYAPMGELLILQPEESVSPHHPLLPSGSGLYLLSYPGSTSGTNSDGMLSRLRAAQLVFFNSPHPLEILSEPAAYGSDGSIYRDHDMKSYVRSVRAVIRQELKLVRKAKREHRRYMWWPLVAPQIPAKDVVAGWHPETRIVVSQGQQRRHSFSGVLRTGKESLRRFCRLVASRHIHLLVVFLFPARLLVLRALTVVSNQ